MPAVVEVLRGGDVCAVIVEPIQGVGGIIRPPDEFLVGLSLVCGAHGALLIADEVQCGYGRSGRFFAHQWAGIRPDIIAVAKGMGNGFPIGGILIAPTLQASYRAAGHHLRRQLPGLRRRLAVLEVMEDEDLVQHAREMGDYLRTELLAQAGAVEIRGRGLMLGIKYDFPVKEIRDKLLTEHHIFVGNASDPTVLRLLPPLNIRKDEVDRFLGGVV
ncbi:MAG: aminotransferase class III-fold pyridoxal phosphate-dependent enzyme [Hymenobacter sp.]